MLLLNQLEQKLKCLRIFSSRSSQKHQQQQRVPHSKRGRKKRRIPRKIKQHLLEQGLLHHLVVIRNQETQALLILPLFRTVSKWNQRLLLLHYSSLLLLNKILKVMPSRLPQLKYNISRRQNSYSPKSPWSRMQAPFMKWPQLRHRLNSLKSKRLHRSCLSTMYLSSQRSIKNSLRSFKRFKIRFQTRLHSRWSSTEWSMLICRSICQVLLRLNLKSKLSQLFFSIWKLLIKRSKKKSCLR